MLIIRETHLPLFPDNRQGKCSWTERHTRTAHTRLHQTHGATWKRPLYSLLPAQLTGEPVPTSDLLPPSSVDSGPSRARLPPLPSVLQGSSGCGCPTLLLPGHLGCCALCCVRSVQHTARTAARPPAPSEGLLCVSYLQRKKTVFAAEQHSLEPSIKQWKPKATSTRMPHPLPRMPACRGWHHRPASTRLIGTLVPCLPPYTTTDFSGSCRCLSASGNGPTVFSSIPPISTHAKNFLGSNLDPSCFNLVQLGPP